MDKLSVFGSQGKLDLRPVVEVEDNGIQMGVLSDGTPYLTLYGLAKLCGIDPAPLLMFTSNWETEKYKKRGSIVLKDLEKKGHRNVINLYTKVINKHGVETHAYPDYICMAILRYYVFDAARFDNTIARENYDILAEYTLKRMIYEKANYKPNQDVINKSWDVFKQRIIANDEIPVGYFSIFREMADLTVKLINSEFKLDPFSIPDISVGQRWAKHWKDANLEKLHGSRMLHPHNYPEDFPQSRGTQKEAYIYPSSALGDFRVWLDTTYVNNHLATYLSNKVRAKALPEKQAEQILLAVRKPELPKKH
ncbi:hypothetical protein JI723_14100 [Providencia manganoxydans]|uniref:BstA-like C-terminal domain-containing protein n=1 Tax=Providencia manganoxydans TaxID=2923283 RepID=A0ABX7AC73_9GAMM|nr:hypothetical protein [Providencia rettgeri]MBS0918228.1 hypothetical protein [Providencia rettgeri]QQO61396.1 hypothetical protein JI723_14100 [Providencia manganoxydans]